MIRLRLGFFMWAMVKKNFIFTNKKYDKEKKTIIFLGSLTNNGDVLSSLGDKYNIIYYLNLDLDIEVCETLLKSSFLIINAKDISRQKSFAILSNLKSKYRLKVIISNSIMNEPAINNAVSLRIATLAILRDLYSIKQVPKEQVTNSIILFDKIAVNSGEMRDSLEYFVAEYLPAKILLAGIVENSFNDVRFLEKQIFEVETINLENIKISKVLCESKCFDHKYMGVLSSREESAFFYIRTQRKNLYKLCPNPAPGFSTSKWVYEHKSRENIPLYDAMDRGECSTHICLFPPFAIEECVKRKLAIHIHLFYIELAEEFCDFLSNIPYEYDLYVTIVNSSDINHLKAIFSSSGAKRIAIHVVENIGRDIAPMLFDLKNTLLNGQYEIIGHFHSKKSVAIEGDVGNRWRKYLLNNLIGRNRNYARSILSLFDDEKVGLIFPESKNYIDIGDNKKYINLLCRMLKMSEIGNTPLFPVGNMYWARVDAIRDLFYLEKDSVLQQEPLSNDGSYMHAIERIIPYVVEKNNYSYVTVYNKESSC
ncbi:rhamnan synthesis F family protein [Francisella sp. SYW-9]|uniref:rhamnan synthesis F family protein n=1 Tax=Francisella sp. SYW-9 TaxID=2610888 RepID=UPI00168CC2A1|nr:rhamnan synthesis F family protein [Francisella sp. SYW-9]